MYWIATIAAVVVAVVAVWRLHRWLLSLEERGVIRYVRSKHGSASNVFMEMDKLANPSVEYVQEAEDRVVQSQDQGGR